MRALQITNLNGPREALRLVDLPEPEADHEATPGEGVLVDVHAAGVSFPELLQTRGGYQIRPDLPFVPGSEVAGIVRSAPAGSRLAPGDRVAAFCRLGGFAETAVAPEYLTFGLPDELGFDQGAGLILNYHTAWFCMVTRGGLLGGETVLIHGAAGGVGTACLQVAKGLGARTIAVVSTDEKEQIARDAGADEVVRSTGPWKDEVKALGGVDMVVDPVGDDRFIDSLRTLNPEGRLIVVGFAGGAIPEVKVNRLLLNNISVVGAGWGEFAQRRPQLCRDIGDGLDQLVEAGFVAPIVGARFPLERAADALELLDGRGATGKVVLDVRAS
jgi:NADPH2:quinone reductase